MPDPREPPGRWKREGPNWEGLQTEFPPCMQAFGQKPRPLMGQQRKLRHGQVCRVHRSDLQTIERTEKNVACKLCGAVCPSEDVLRKEKGRCSRRACFSSQLKCISGAPVSASVVPSVWTPAAALRTGGGVHRPLRGAPESCSSHKVTSEASEGTAHRRKATNCKCQKLSHKTTYF